MCRKIITLFVVVMLVAIGSCSVFAEELDLSKTGSITVTLTEPKQKEPIVGAELSVYAIATASLDENGRLIFDYTDVLEGFQIAMDDPDLALKLDAFVPQNCTPLVKGTTNQEGTAICDQLPLGLYFVKQTNTVAGFAPCTSFLVTIPNQNNEQYVYAVNASPKTQVARLTSITIQKIWNTDGSTAAANSVTVQLLEKEKVVRTATLNAQNNWQITYNDLPESDAYSIKELDVPQGFTATYTQSGSVFTVTNTATLIQTGQLIWPIPVLAVGGMLFLAAGVLILQKKRKANG